MVEAVVSETVQAVLRQPLLQLAISLSAEELSLLWGFKGHLTRLEGSLTMVQAFLRDVEKRQQNDEAIKVWLQNLEAVAYDADDVLDGFDYKILQCKIQIGNQMERKVCSVFSLSNPILFGSKMTYKAGESNTNLKVIILEGIDFSLQTPSALADVSPFSISANQETDSISIALNFIGREEDTSKIDVDDDTISVIAILGMDGIGNKILTEEKLFTCHR